MLTVHAEACKHLDSTLREIRKAGMKVGVAINPGNTGQPAGMCAGSGGYGTDHDSQSWIWWAELY